MFGMSVSGIVVVVVVLVALIGIAASYYDNFKNPPPPDLNDGHIAELAKAGKRTRALRWYRQLHGGRLKDAVAALDRIIKNQMDGR